MSKWVYTGSLKFLGETITTTVVVREQSAFFACQDGSFWGVPLSTLPSISKPLFKEPVGCRGTMALDAGRGRIYAPRNCSLLETRVATCARSIWGELIWERPVSLAATSAPCHAAVASSGMIYTACGSSVRFFHLDKPG